MAADSVTAKYRTRREALASVELNGPDGLEPLTLDDVTLLRA